KNYVRESQVQRMRYGNGPRRARASRNTLFFFFFSSRRRHTRFKCDWSSDVCSSDLAAVQLHQLLVAAVLDDAAAGEDRDLIGHAHRGEAVRDEDGDALARELAEVLEHLGLRLRIHGGGRLIEHEDIRAGAHEGARQGDLLPLAAGELAALAEPLAELGVIARGQRLDELARPALHRRRTPALLVLEEALVARPHVLAHQH